MPDRVVRQCAADFSAQPGQHDLLRPLSRRSHGRFIPPFEVIIPAVVPGSTYAMPPGTGDLLATFVLDRARLHIRLCKSPIGSFRSYSMLEVMMGAPRLGAGQPGGRLDRGYGLEPIYSAPRIPSLENPFNT